MRCLAGEVEDAGFAIVPGVLSAGDVDGLVDAIERLSCERVAFKRGGIRNLLDRAPEVRAVSESAPIRRLVEAVLGSHAFVARGILFDKTPDANWKVHWHQDLTIAVQDRIEAVGFGPWTIKDGVQHVQPPTEVLEGMLAVRIHLDDCGEDNGPLKVNPVRIDRAG